MLIMRLGSQPVHGKDQLAAHSAVKRHRRTVKGRYRMGANKWLLTNGQITIVKDSACLLIMSSLDLQGLVCSISYPCSSDHRGVLMLRSSHEHPHG